MRERVMTENPPTFKEWQELYKFAICLKQNTPWEWMTEVDIFGVQNPKTDEIGFVSVMGMADEHYAVAVYMRSEGLYGFWDLQDAGPHDHAERLLEIPQLQASFEDRDSLDQKDYDIIKKLGLKFRGRHAWPMFRTYRPGLLPWFMGAEEAHFMICVLEQTLDVALRYREDETLLETLSDEEYLVRVPHKEDSTLAWEDSIMRVPPPEPPDIQIFVNAEELKGLKLLPQSTHTIEIDFFMLPATVGEKGTRGFWAYNLLMVDSKTGLIVGNESLIADPSLEAMWGSIPDKVVHQLSRAGTVPKEIRVRSELLLQLLNPLAVELRLKLKQTRTLQMLSSVREILLRHLR
jgi:hypothetical protein